MEQKPIKRGNKMMDINLDELFNKQDAEPAKKTYTTIPTDRYDAHVHHAQVDLTRDVPRVTINYKITEHAEFKGRLLFSSYTLNDTGAVLLKKTLRKLGVETSKLKSLDDLSAALGDIHGRDCNVFAKLREYKKQDGSTGYAHNVYVNACDHDVDNMKSSDDALLKASDGSADDFSFD